MSFYGDAALCGGYRSGCRSILVVRSAAIAISGGEAQRQDDKRLAPIGLDDEQVTGFEPRIELAESILAAFALNSAINAEDGNCQVAAIPTARRAGQRDTLGAEAVVLKQAHNRALEAVAFLA
jgi:hypothetical protein